MENFACVLNGLTLSLLNKLNKCIVLKLSLKIHVNQHNLITKFFRNHLPEIYCWNKSFDVSGCFSITINIKTKFRFSISLKNLLREKCPNTDFFWSLFSRIWTLFMHCLNKSVVIIYKYHTHLEVKPFLWRVVSAWGLYLIL